MAGAALLDLATYLPPRVLGNEELASLYPGWTAAKIHDKTGIRCRHIAGPDETAGDLAFMAVSRLLSQGVVRADDVDFLILCTQAPDYILPTTACLLQDRLGLPKSAGALDVNLGCSGFVYCLALANGLIASGAAKCVIVATADTYSKYIHPLDKSVRTLFGDGAAAVAVGAGDAGGASIGPFVFGTDGAGAPHLMVRAGGFRQPLSAADASERTDESGNVHSDRTLFMDGSEVMSFAIREVPAAVTRLLAKAQLDAGAVDYFVLHQANAFMLETLRRKLKLPAGKMPVCLEEVGNTVSSTIPIVLADMRARGCFAAPRRLMLVGFGVGLSWCACLMTTAGGL